MQAGMQGGVSRPADVPRRGGIGDPALQPSIAGALIRGTDPTHCVGWRGGVGRLTHEPSLSRLWRAVHGCPGVSRVAWVA